MIKSYFKLFILFTTLLYLYGCAGTSNLKSGDQAFQQKAFYVAASLYKTEYVSAENQTRKAEIAFRIGESYRLTGKTKDAEKWYAEAVRLKYKPIAKFNYGLMLKTNGKYDQAIVKFREYAKDDPFKKQLAFDMIKSAELAKKWEAERTNMYIENMGNINTEASEYAPIFYKNKDLIFTSDRIDATGEDIYNWTGEQYSDLFLSKRKDDGAYVGVVSFSNILNSGVNEGTPTFNKNFTEVYFTRCGTQGKDDDYCHIYYSYINVNGNWSTPFLVPFFPDTINIGHPALSPDGEFIVFAAEPENTFGGKDLYISKKDLNGWALPENMGKSINTEGDELFPYIDEEGSLFFASNGLPGMGGLDIFKASLEGRIWRNVQNLKPPINTSADDYAIIYEKTKAEGPEDAVRQIGYFSSNRNGGKGKDDLYRFALNNENIYILDGIVIEKVFADPTDPNSKIIDFKRVENASIEIKRYKGGYEKLATLLSDEKGKFEYELKKDNEYLLKANKADYLSKTLGVNTIGLVDLENVTIKIKVRVILEKLLVDVEIVIDNIYYDYNDVKLRPESFIVLDTLVNMMVDNPKIILEIGSHTDSRGSDSYNETLSLGRAQSVVNYLIEKNINTARLKAKGYGESNLVNECIDDVECTEEQHQENRRTTFRILSEEYNIESIKPDSIRVDPKQD